jgi:hypothetical protein
MALQCINSIYPLVEWLTKAKFIIDLNPISFSEIGLNVINERMVIHEMGKFFENIRCAKMSSINTEQIQNCIEQALTINKFDPTSLIKFILFDIIEKNLKSSNFINANFYGDFLLKGQCAECSDKDRSNLRKFCVLSIDIDGLNPLFNIDDHIKQFTMKEKCCTNINTEASFTIQFFPNILIVTIDRIKQINMATKVNTPINLSLTDPTGNNSLFILSY